MCVGHAITHGCTLLLSFCQLLLLAALFTEGHTTLSYPRVLYNAVKLTVTLRTLLGIYVQ